MANFHCRHTECKSLKFHYFLITSAKEDMFSSLFVCLSLCLLATLRKNFRSDLHEFSGKVCNGLMNKLLNFGGDPDHRLDTGIVFRIRHYWEIRKVVRQMAGLISRHW